MPITLSISPHGRPFIERGSDDEAAPGLSAAAEARIEAAFAEDAAGGLLRLATAELQTTLPASLGFAREVARLYLTRLSHTAGVEGAKDLPAVPAPSAEELNALALR